MESSRIFIRGLPPNLREDDLRQRFAQVAPITDLKYLPRRRLAYVGYRNADTAAKAAKYFNRSFIRMSRVNVVVAEPFQIRSDEAPPARPAPDGPRSIPDAPTTDSKAGMAAKHGMKDLMDITAAKKRKTWANDDDAAISTPSHPPAALDDAQRPSSPERPADLPIRKAVSHEHLSGEQASPANEIFESQNQNTPMAELEAQAQAELTQEKRPDVAPVVSDEDWLRSRTSRLLGLAEDDPADAQPSPPPQSPTTGAKPSADQSNVEVSVPDVPEVSMNTPGDSETQIAPPPLAESGSARLFARNLAYSCSEQELANLCSPFGELDEVHLPLDSKTGVCKGYGYVQFREAEAASRALQTLDGQSFQGRLLHLLRASPKRVTQLDDYTLSKLPLKVQRRIQLKHEAPSSSFRWNSLYMSPDAILSSVADRLGVPKSEIVDPTSSDAAIRQAHAEVNVVQETKAYFAAQGVDLDAFQRRERSDRAILVKNFPYGTSPDELRRLFEEHAEVTRILMPPSGTIAIVEVAQGPQVSKALRALAYRRIKDSVLFLERAPRGILDGRAVSKDVPQQPKETQPPAAPSELLGTAVSGEAASSTLFVRNLNFSTTTRELRDLFQPLAGFLSARVKTKTDPKKPGQLLSMGFGFVEFSSPTHAQAALMTLNGHKLGGHDLVIQQSHRTADAAEERRSQDRMHKLASQGTKVVIKNLPFEASKSDVRRLLTPYGQLRSVRLPKKFTNQTRGFAFAEFISAKEAENAMATLQGTHLLGRRLNLAFAAADSIDPEAEIERMQQRVGNQTDKLALQKLTSGGRKRFTMQQDEDPEALV